MSKPLRVLIVEDSKADAELLLVELKHGGYEPTAARVDTAEAMSAALDRSTWDIILADYIMPSFSGLAALKLLQSTGIDLPFIVVSGQIGEAIAVDAMKAGASDYILKGHLARLAPAVERELREAEVRREGRKAEQERDRLMQQLRDVNEQVVLSNIQTQEQAEEVQRQAAELDAIITAIAEPLITCGPKGEIVRMNPAAEELLGDSRGESGKPLGERLAQLHTETPDGKPFPPEDSPIARALRGETVRGVVALIHRPSEKKPTWLSISAAPIRAADGKLWGAVAVFANIAALHEKR